jgi:hypothetical protein
MTVAMVVSGAGLYSKQEADEVIRAAKPSSDHALALRVGGVVGVAYLPAFLLLYHKSGVIVHATESKLQGCFIFRLALTALP